MAGAPRAHEMLSVQVFCAALMAGAPQRFLRDDIQKVAHSELHDVHPLHGKNGVYCAWGLEHSRHILCNMDNVQQTSSILDDMPDPDGDEVARSDSRKFASPDLEQLENNVENLRNRVDSLALVVTVVILWTTYIHAHS